MVETGACFGLPLIAIAAIFLRARWAEMAPGCSAWFHLMRDRAFASLGPRLHVAGVMLFGLPLKLLRSTPGAVESSHT